MINFLRTFDKVFPAKNVYAHCDVPCGIYDPKAAQIAAQTVVRMVELIEQLVNDNGNKDKNSMTRYVITKEDHAQKCKSELLILWTDFFKSEHLKAYPKLHTIFWEAAKLCSYNKQNVDMNAAKDLERKVDEIAVMFNKAKSASNK